MKKNHKIAMLKYYGILLALCLVLAMAAALNFIPEAIIEKYDLFIVMFIVAYGAFWLFMLFKYASTKEFQSWQKHCEKKAEKNQENNFKRLKVTALVWGIIEVILVVLTVKFVWAKPLMDSIRINIDMTVLVSLVLYGVCLLVLFLQWIGKKLQNKHKTSNHEDAE